LPQRWIFALPFGTPLPWKNLGHHRTTRLSPDSNGGQRDSFPYRAAKFRSGKRNIKSSVKSGVITGIVRRVSRSILYNFFHACNLAGQRFRTGHGPKATLFCTSSLQSGSLFAPMLRCYMATRFRAKKLFFLGKMALISKSTAAVFQSVTTSAWARPPMRSAVEADRERSLKVWIKVNGWVARSLRCVPEFSRPQSMVIAPVSTVSTGSE
jgi:hypothetical protein